MFTSADEVLRFIRDEKVEFVDIRFTDLPGTQQHLNTPARFVDEKFFTDGIQFDGSSIRGFAQIHKSDMTLIPDPATAYVDPFRAAKTLNINFSIVDPRTGEPYERDPRQVAQKAEAHLKTTGIADTMYVGPEAEFYAFDDVRFETRQNAGFYYIDSIEGQWNTGREEAGGNRGYKTRYKSGYFPVPPTDHYADLRDQMVTALLNAGLGVEKSHHEVGTAGQAEINYNFNTLTHAADDLLKYKYIIKNVAWASGKTVTFMPKPLFGDNGSGMHCHQSLWKDGSPLFYDELGCCTTRPRCWRSRTRRSTPITGWCRASRLRSTSSTARATARPASGCRSPAPTRRRSASSSASPTRPATRTSHSRRC
jgi:glutamine synthetase